MIIKQIQSSRTDEIYKVRIYPDEKRVTCTCTGFKTKGRCKHIRHYKDITKKHFCTHEDIVKSFRNCKDLVKQLVDQKPYLADSYNELVAEVHNYKSYSTETITRTFRKLKEEGEITESEEVKENRRTAEETMKHINIWEPTNISFTSSQTRLMEK
jgi:vacuolar-type H+-ATPase subunit I/STV1